MPTIRIQVNIIRLLTELATVYQRQQIRLVPQLATVPRKGDSFCMPIILRQDLSYLQFLEKGTV